MDADRRGEAFELATAEMFRLLGFQVERNALIAGSQVDLVLRRSTGAIREVYLVECKDYQDPVGIAALRSFWASLEAARRELPGANGIFVTRQDLTKEAKAFADSIGIQHLTLRDLESRLVDLTPYARTLVDQFEEAAWSKHYVKPVCYLGKESSDRQKQRGGAAKPPLALVGEPSPVSPAPETGVGDLLRDLDIALQAINNELARSSPGLKKLRGQLVERLALARSNSPDVFLNDLREVSRRDMQSTVEDWLKRPDCPGLLILGDYGTGKTTFLQRFGAHQAYRLISEPEAQRCPVLLYLKDFPGGLDARTLLLAISDALGDPGVNRNLVERFLRRGRFLLLLDGFDEMGLQVDARTRRTAFVSLLRLMLLPGAKVIISGRPGYFPSLQELEAILDLVGGTFEDVGELRVEALTIAPFDDEQIEAYLGSFQWNEPGLTLPRVKEVIHQVYNLRELAERPFLLDLIVKTIPALEKHELQEISPGRLYEIYTERWLSREYSKGEFRWLIQRSEKKAFMVELAWRMLMRGSLKIHFSELAAWVRSYFSVSSPETIDYLAQDIRTCSFLSRDDEGYYAFVHRSFMEFFVGLRLVEGAERTQSFQSMIEGVPVNGLTENSIAFAIDLIWRRFGVIGELLEALIPSDSSFVGAVKALATILSLPKRVSQACIVAILGDERWRQAMRVPENLEGGWVIGTRGARVWVKQPMATEASGWMSRFFSRKKQATEDGMYYCHFCGALQSEVWQLIAGPTTFICSECVYEASLYLAIDPERAAGGLPSARCSFCNKAREEILKILSDPSGKSLICFECVDICVDIMREKAELELNPKVG